MLLIVVYVSPQSNCICKWQCSCTLVVGNKSNLTVFFWSKTIENWFETERNCHWFFFTKYYEGATSSKEKMLYVRGRIMQNIKKIIFWTTAYCAWEIVTAKVLKTKIWREKCRLTAMNRNSTLKYHTFLEYMKMIILSLVNFKESLSCELKSKGVISNMDHVWLHKIIAKMQGL